MGYFVEEAHTKNEWVYKRHHTVLLGSIFTFILFVIAIALVIVGASLREVRSSNTLQAILIFGGLFFDFVIAFYVIELLGKGWTIFKKQIIALIFGKKVNVTIDNIIGIPQIIRIPKK